MADKESTIKTIFALDGETKYRDAIKDINREQSGLRAEMSKIDAAYKINGDRVQYNKDKVEVLNKQVDLQKRRVDETRNAMEQASKVYGENSEEAQKYRTQLTRAETGLMKLEEELRKSTEELKKQETALYQAGQSAIETGEKWQSTGEKMGQAGMAMTKGVTAPLAAIAAASTAAFIEVDQSLDDIVKATGATGAELENLHQVWENVVTTMPIDLAAASDAVGELNTQFGTFGDELEDQTRLTVQFAEITGQDVVGAVQGAKKAIELFGLETEDYGRVLDIVAKAGQDTGVSVDKIWDAVKRGAPALKELDLDVEESVLLLSQLEQSGLDANKAIGYLGRAEATLAKDGVSLAEGLREFGEVVESSASHTDKLAQASELFGTRGAVFMLEAAQQGALDFEALADAAGGAAGTVESTFEATLDPIDGFKTAMNNAKIAGAELSTAIQTAAAPMIEGLVGVLQGAVTKFKELPPETQEFIVKIGALIGAIGPLLIIGGKLTSWVGDLTTGWGNLLTKMAGSEGILSGVIEKFGAGGTLGLAGAAVAAAGAIYLIVKELTAIDPALKAAREAMEKADKSAKEASDSFTAQANQIERYRDELFELMDVEDKSEVQKQRLANVVERMNELMPELNLEYEKETDQLNLTKGAIDGVIDATRERLREAARSTIIQSYLEAEEGILVDIAEKYRQQMQLEDSLHKIEEARNQALLTGLSEYEINMLSMSEAQQKAAGFNIELTVAQEEAMKSLTQTVEEQKDEVGRFTEMSTEGWGSVGGAVTNLTTEIGRLDTEQTDLKDTMEDLITEGERAADAFDIMSEKTGDLGETTQDTADDIEDGQDRIASAVEDSAERQEIALEDLEKASEKHKNSMNGFTKERFDYEKGTTAEFMAMWEEELTAFQSYHENLQIIASKVGPDVAEELAKLGPAAAPLIQQFVDGSDEDLAKLAGIVHDRTEAAVIAAGLELGRLADIGEGAGKDFMVGLSKGIRDNTKTVIDAARTSANVIKQATESGLGISSPSKVGIDIGRNYAESTGIGIERGTDKPKRSAAELAQAIIDSTELSSLDRLVASPGGGYGPVTVISQGAAQPGPVLSPSVTVNMYGAEASPAHMAREAEIMLERFTHS